LKSKKKIKIEGGRGRERKGKGGRRGKEEGGEYTRFWLLGKHLDGSFR
jgi:hypothetical protein